MFGCAPAPAAVSAMAKNIAGFASPALEAIIEALTASHVAHFDETGSGRREAGLGPLGVGREVRAGLGALFWKNVERVPFFRDFPVHVQQVQTGSRHGHHRPA